MLIATLFALIAVAAEPASPPVPTSAAPASGDHHLSRPPSIGAPHSCAEDKYPVSAMRGGVEGTTVMIFTITKEGHVADMSVRTSSGNAALDDASLSCAREWLYQPAMQDGAPVDVKWLAQVKWYVRVPPPWSGLADGARSCLQDGKVGWEEVKATFYRPVVLAHIAGGVMTVTLAGTSGNSDLDDRTLACYRSLPPDLTAGIPDSDKLIVLMKPDD